MAEEPRLRVGRRPKLTGLGLEEAIIALAERQHGTVARVQLLELGLGSCAIKRRLRSGRLHSVHRGVYALGHRRLSVNGRYMAAVLAAGRHAVLSHRSAADLWEIRSTASRQIEVSAPARRQAGPVVRTYEASLIEDEVTVRDGIPVTTAARTLLDLAAVLAPHRLESALREAEYRRLWDATSLQDLLERHPRRKGTAAFRAILASNRTAEGRTRSELELSFIALLDAHRLPRPKPNRHVRAGDDRLYEGDCVWPDERLIVELDSRSAHDRPGTFESDRARDRALSVAGWRTVRLTARQLEHEGAAVASDLRRLIEGAAPR